MVIYCYCFNYGMEFNNYALDLLVDDQKINFLDDTLVLRWPATSGLVSSSSLFSKTEKNIDFFFSDNSSLIEGYPQLSSFRQSTTTSDRKVPSWSCLLALVRYFTVRYLAVRGKTWRYSTDQTKPNTRVNPN